MEKVNPFADVQMPSDADLKKVADLAEEQIVLEDELDDLLRLTKECKAKLAEVSEVKLPTLMRELGLNSFQLEDGPTITVKTELYTHISQKNKPDALKWLRDNGFGSLIKERVLQESVAGASVKALIREQLSLGKAVPLQVFGVHEVTRSVIK